MALLLWILVSTTLAVSSAVKPDIFQNARCQAFCKTQYPQQVVLGSLKYVVCNSTDCQECVKPCSLDFVSFNACNTSCSGSSACEASCDFLKDALFGNVPFEKNISSPGKPIAQGTNFTSIELSWSPPNGTSTIGVVYIVMMSYGGDLSSNGWIRLNQVFHTPGAVISDFYLCKNITGFNETVGPRETYNGIYYKFYVIAVTLLGAPATGDPSNEIQLQRPDAPGNVTFNLVRYGPMGLRFDELQFQGSWTAPAAYISRYFIVWNGSNCYSTPGNYIRRYSTTDQKITFYLPYEQKTGCQNEFKVYALVGCSVSLAETVVVTNPGCRNVSSFPTWKCCSVDPPMALGAEELMVQNLTRGPLSLGNECRFTFKISWDPPPYLARTGCNALFVIYSYRYGDPRVPGPWGRIDYKVNNEVELNGIDPGILFKFEIHANIKFNPEVISQINFTVPSSGPETKVQNLTLTLVTDSSGARSIVAEWENPTYSSCVSHFLLNFTFGDGTYITAIINITTYTIPVPENSVPPLTNAFPVGNMAAPRIFTLTVTPLFTNPLLIGIPATISAPIPPLGDTNECMTNNGGCNQTCVNTVGSFFCACRPGYMLAADNQTCLDIDECVTSNGGCNQICMNTMGSYKCLCRPGYMLSANNQTCVDMNECMMNNGGCSQFCINTPGSYQCFCRPGYKLAMDFKTCLDIDECTASNKGGCSDICYNIPGSYKCFCKPGSQLQPDGKTCKRTVTTRCQRWYCKTRYYGYGYRRYYRYRYRPIYAVCRNGQLHSCAGNGYYYYKPYNIPCWKCHPKGYWNKYYHVKKSWKMFGRRGKKFRGFG